MSGPSPDEAAIKIQAGYRGYAARKELGKASGGSNDGPDLAPSDGPDGGGQGGATAAPTAESSSSPPLPSSSPLPPVAHEEVTAHAPRAAEDDVAVVAVPGSPAPPASPPQPQEEPHQQKREEEAVVHQSSTVLVSQPQSQQTQVQSQAPAPAPAQEHAQGQEEPLPTRAASSVSVAGSEGSGGGGGGGGVALPSREQHEILMALAASLKSEGKVVEANAVLAAASAALTVAQGQASLSSSSSLSSPAHGGTQHQQQVSHGGSSRPPQEFGGGVGRPTGDHHDHGRRAVGGSGAGVGDGGDDGDDDDDDDDDGRETEGEGRPGPSGSRSKVGSGDGSSGGSLHGRTTPMKKATRKLLPRPPQVPQQCSLIATASGWTTKELTDEPAEDAVETTEILTVDSDCDWYNRYFVKQTHALYLGITAGYGPVVIAFCRALEDLQFFRVLVMHNKRTEKKVLPSLDFNIRNSKSFPSVKTLLNTGTVLSGVAANELICVTGKKVMRWTQRIIDLEAKFFRNTYKMGVVLVKEGQTNEDIIFANDTTPHFEKFLRILGKKVELKGYKGFAGGLDVENDTTGVSSVMTKWMNYEVMFHVAPYLPFDSEDPQQIQRKRHIGNDVCTIVFLESDTPYCPTTITSKMNHVIVVVQPIAGRSSFRVECCFDESVQPFAPVGVKIVPKDHLQDYVMSLAVNGERASYSAASFMGPAERMRSILLNDLLSIM